MCRFLRSDSHAEAGSRGHLAHLPREPRTTHLPWQVLAAVTLSPQREK